MTPPARYPGNTGVAATNPTALYTKRKEELLGAGRNMALRLFLVYLFVIFSRIFDYVLTGYHISAILFLAAVPAAFLCGAWQKISLKGPVKWILAFIFWVALAIPFSVWKGGSAQLFRSLLVAVLSFVPLLGLPMSFRDIRRIWFVLGLSTCFFGACVSALGRFEGGRLLLEQQGTFSNANDLAQLMLLGLPFAVYGIFELRRNPLAVVLGVLCLVPMIPALSQTGSRSMLLAAAIMFLIALIRAPLGIKFGMTVGAIILVVVGFLLLPPVVRLRYMTFFHPARESGVSAEDYEAQMSAVRSAVTREELLKDAVTYTLKNPIVGVGPGMFAVARGKDAEARNITGQWRVGHNAFLQVSSECGIPGAIFYVLMIGSSILATWRADRYHRRLNNPLSQSIRAASFALFVSIISFVVFGMFLSNAYVQQVLTLIPLSVVLERISREELDRLKRAAQGATPEPPQPQKFSYAMLPR